MDENTIKNQGQTNTLTSLEKELEALKEKAAREYQHKKTASPMRTKVDSLDYSIENKPTYLEESQLDKTTNLGTEVSNPKPGSSKIIFWAGLGLLVLAIVLAGVYYFFRII